MTESILTTIKKMCGLDSSNTDFDTDLIIEINGVLSVLYQLGVTATPVRITGATETWSTVIGNFTDIEMLKTYMYLKVKHIFDPDTNSSLLEARKKVAEEYEWRLREAIELRPPVN